MFRILSLPTMNISSSPTNWWPSVFIQTRAAIKGRKNRLRTFRRVDGISLTTTV
jgi:hypothetical protein